jgi:hypothetical protein
MSPVLAKVTEIDSLFAKELVVFEKLAQFTVK